MTRFDDTRTRRPEQAGWAWAGVVALVLAAISALSNFLFIPYYPIWSLLMIGLACWVIRSVTRPGVLPGE